MHMMSGLATGFCALTLGGALGVAGCSTDPPLIDSSAVQSALDQLVEADSAPGALVQVRDRTGRSVTLTAGTSELGSEVPMVGAEGEFRVGSITKPFVALAVLQRVARGEVVLDQPIESYLPGVVRGTGEGAAIDGHQITVRQLLQHTSGVPDYVQFLSSIPQTPVDPGDLVALALAHAPDFTPPGASWHYSNTGYMILGLMLEHLAGKDINSILVEQIIQPVGLTGTYWPPPGERSLRGIHAHNYGTSPQDPGGALIDVTDLEPSVAWASGQLVSTPDDLDRFWQALFEDGLLPRSLLDEMTTALELPASFGGAGYGLGLYREPLSCGGFYWGHSGDHLGVQAMSGRDDSGRQVTVYITRRQHGDTSMHIADTMNAAFCSGGGR